MSDMRLEAAASVIRNLHLAIVIYLTLRRRSVHNFCSDASFQRWRICVGIDGIAAEPYPESSYLLARTFFFSRADLHPVVGSFSIFTGLPTPDSTDSISDVQRFVISEIFQLFPDVFIRNQP